MIYKDNLVALLHNKRNCKMQYTIDFQWPVIARSENRVESWVIGGRCESTSTGLGLQRA